MLSDCLPIRGRDCYFPVENGSRIGNKDVVSIKHYSFFFCNNDFTFPFFLSLSLYFILFIIIYPFFALFHLPPSPTITTLLAMPMRSLSLTSHSRYKQVWFLSPLTSAKSRRNEIQHGVKILHFRTMCSSRKLSGLAIFFFFLPDRFLNSFHF